MKQFLKDYLTFSQTEKRGIFFLLLLIILSFSSPILLPYFIKNQVIDYTVFRKEIEELKKYSTNKDSINDNERQEFISPQKTEIRSVELFVFDPNTVSSDDWKKLGVREKTIHTITNYLSKGGKFYKKEDLKKIYGFANDYERLEKFISIEKKSTPDKLKTNFEKPEKKSEVFVTKPKEIFQIEINSADSLEWIKLNGIGEKLASRIIKYRNSLGGFVNLGQVKEALWRDSLTFYKIESHLMLKKTEIQKININTADFEQLKKHPYLSNSVSKQIINYRQQHENYKSIDDLKKLYLMNEELLEKLEPYLTVE